MSNLPISSKYVSSPELPVDADEREAMVARVNAAYESGQLDEFDYRAYLDIAFGAKTLGQLRPVAEGVPALPTYATPGNIERASATPGEVSPSKAPSGRLVGMIAGVGALALLALVIVLVLLVL